MFCPSQETDLDYRHNLTLDRKSQKHGWGRSVPNRIIKGTPKKG